MSLLRLLRLLSVNTQLCFIEIFSNKTRSLITSFGIFLGAVSLLANISFIRAIDNDIKEKMAVIGGLNILTIKQKPAENSAEKRRFNKSPGLKASDAEDIQKSFSFVRSYLRHFELHWGPVNANGKSTGASINAIDPQYLRAYKIDAEFIPPFNVKNLEQSEPVCIIGKQIASRLFGDNVPAAGKSVIINKVTFQIIGQIETGDQFSWRGWQVFLPYEYYRKKFMSSQTNPESFEIELVNSSFEKDARAAFRVKLLELHRGVEDFIIESNADKIGEMKAASSGMKVILVCIAVITLVIGGISIMNIMFAAIGDRVREIGVRKALGANNRDVLVQFVIESILLCLVGGIPGLALGTSVTLFPKGMFPFNPQLLTEDYIVAITFIVVTGIGSGLAPAIKAASLRPADALRF
ncbi:MAG TPA: FtsX-like permease family protein [Chitinispirillaceae bacterium]|nr:FtsX-like permease family protein [Chitinispirillaceae bacterium]